MQRVLGPLCETLWIDVIPLTPLAWIGGSMCTLHARHRIWLVCVNDLLGHTPSVCGFLTQLHDFSLEHLLSFARNGSLLVESGLILFKLFLAHSSLIGQSLT